MSILDPYEFAGLFFFTEEDFVKEGDLRAYNGTTVYASDVIHRYWPRKNIVWWKQYFPLPTGSLPKIGEEK